MESLTQLPVTKPRLIAISASPSNGILNPSIRNEPVSGSELVRLLDPCHPGKVTCHDASTISPFELPAPTPGACKSLSFCAALPSSFLSAKWQAARFLNH